tara:strand:+ start:8869 stop:11502 length:2634 start_codon:yes stop_codon:yes gene_type:complete
MDNLPKGVTGYRNIIDNRNGTLKIFTWNEHGERIIRNVSHSPYMMLEDSRGEYDSIFDSKLKKYEFRNSWERKKYLTDKNITRTFECIQPEQQYLIDTFWRYADHKDFTKNQLRTLLFDIETYSPTSFPEWSDPKDPINAITIYDLENKHYFTWGLGAWKPGQHESVPDNVTYINCKSEAQLLENFIVFIENDYPDILSGWNSNGFDIPYTVSRIDRVLGDGESARLSPTHRINKREMLGQFGKMTTRFYIEGVSCIDYIDVYKKFIFKNRSSYKLDNIAQVELNDEKIDYGDLTLWQLADENWQLFVDYNIQDVRIIVRLEEKLNFISLLRMFAHVGCCTLERSMGAIAVINGSVAIEARKHGKFIPQFIRHGNDEKNPGAYVCVHNPGFNDSIVSFDANSLYPSVMITCNISPETKVGKVTYWDKENNKVEVELVDGTLTEMTIPKFRELLKNNNIAMTAAKVLFSQKKKGVVPLLLDRYYDKRVIVKDEMLVLKKEQASLKSKNDKKSIARKSIVDDEYDRLHANQLAIKVFLNSVYGGFGNKHAPLGDDDIASSITLTGQSLIKQSNVQLAKYIGKVTGLDSETCTKQIIYNDTDSSYISIQTLLDHLDKPLLDEDGLVSKDVYSIIQDTEDALNDGVDHWARIALNSKDPRFVFKREAIAERGIFQNEKKRYILKVVDDEGAVGVKFKYTGISVVRTSMPKALKPLIKELIEIMINTMDPVETQKYYNNINTLFNDMSYNELATTQGISDYEKYLPGCREFQVSKGGTANFKAAYFHNQLLKELGLENKYQKIGSGDKVKSIAVKSNNKYGITTIGWQGDIPKEFEDLLDIDYNVMFRKIILSSLENIYKAVEWNLFKPGKAPEIDLDSFFS